MFNYVLYKNKNCDAGDGWGAGIYLEVVLRDNAPRQITGRSCYS